MKEQLITFETAKLAKEKGFNNGSKAVYIERNDGKVDFFDNYYTINNEKGFDLSNDEWTVYEAPTQSLLQKWLYEKHGIFIELIWVDTLSDLFSYHISTTNNTTRPNSNYIRNPFICLEQGLQDALGLL